MSSPNYYSVLSPGGAVISASLKASPGRIYTMQFFNESTSIRYVRLYDQATAPGASDNANIIWRGKIPAAATGNKILITLTPPVAFLVGIGLRITGAEGDTDNTNVASNEVSGNIQFS